MSQTIDLSMYQNFAYVYSLIRHSCGGTSTQNRQQLLRVYVDNVEVFRHTLCSDPLSGTSIIDITSYQEKSSVSFLFYLEGLISYTGSASIPRVYFY